MPNPTDIPAFAASQLTLLDAELKAELSETDALLSSHTPTALARGGLAILNLNVSSVRTGMGGKTIVELALDAAVATKGAKPEIPEHGIRVGDIVALADQPAGSAKKTEKKELEKKGAGGVVLRVRRENIEIVLDKEDADVPGGNKLWMSVMHWRCRRHWWRLIHNVESNWQMMSPTRGTRLQQYKMYHPSANHAHM